MSELARSAQHHWEALAADGTETVVETIPSTAEMLRSMIDQAPDLWAPTRIVELIVPLFRLLAMLHGTGIVHRALSPSVVWIDGVTIDLGV